MKLKELLNKLILPLKGGGIIKLKSYANIVKNVDVDVNDKDDGGDEIDITSLLTTEYLERMAKQNFEEDSHYQPIENDLRKFVKKVYNFGLEDDIVNKLDVLVGAGLQGYQFASSNGYDYNTGDELYSPGRIILYPLSGIEPYNIGGLADQTSESFYFTHFRLAPIEFQDDTYIYHKNYSFNYRGSMEPFSYVENEFIKVAGDYYGVPSQEYIEFVNQLLDKKFVKFYHDSGPVMLVYKTIDSGNEVTLMRNYNSSIEIILLTKNSNNEYFVQAGAFDGLRSVVPLKLLIR